MTGSCEGVGTERDCGSDDGRVVGGTGISWPVEAKEAHDLLIGLVVGPGLVARVALHLTGDDEREHGEIDGVGELDAELLEHLGRRHVLGTGLERHDLHHAPGVTDLLATVATQQFCGFVVADSISEGVVEDVAAVLDTDEQFEGLEVEGLSGTDAGCGFEEIHGFHHRVVREPVPRRPPPPDR